MSDLLNAPNRRVAAHAAQHCASVAPPIASMGIYNGVNCNTAERYIEALMLLWVGIDIDW